MCLSQRVFLSCHHRKCSKTAKTFDYRPESNESNNCCFNNCK